MLLNIHGIKLLKHIQKTMGYEDWENRLTEQINLLTSVIEFRNVRLFEGAVWLFATGDISEEQFLIHIEESLLI